MAADSRNLEDNIAETPADDTDADTQRIWPRRIPRATADALLTDLPAPFSRPESFQPATDSANAASDLPSASSDQVASNSVNQSVSNQVNFSFAAEEQPSMFTTTNSEHSQLPGNMGAGSLSHAQSEEVFHDPVESQPPHSIGLPTEEFLPPPPGLPAPESVPEGNNQSSGDSSMEEEEPIPLEMLPYGMQSPVYWSSRYRDMEGELWTQSICL